MEPPIEHDVLDQGEARPPSRQVEAAEHLELMALDVDRQQIERGGRFRVDENLIERHDRNLGHPGRNHVRHEKIGVQGRLNAGKIERHGLARIRRRRAGDRIDLCAPPLTRFLGQISLRLDQHTIPTKLLQMPGLRPLDRIIGTDVDKKAVGRVAEELFFQLVLDVVAEDGGHGSGMLLCFVAIPYIRRVGSSE